MPLRCTLCRSHLLLPTSYTCIRIGTSKAQEIRLLRSSPISGSEHLHSHPHLVGRHDIRLVVTDSYCSSRTRYIRRCGIHHRRMEGRSSTRHAIKTMDIPHHGYHTRHYLFHRHDLLFESVLPTYLLSSSIRNVSYQISFLPPFIISSSSMLIVISWSDHTLHEESASSSPSWLLHLDNRSRFTNHLQPKHKSRKFGWLTYITRFRSRMYATDYVSSCTSWSTKQRQSMRDWYA